MVERRDPEFFLTAPADRLAAYAPATVLYTPGGTRRRAVLAGVGSSADDYAEWSRRRSLECIGLLFDFGVRHVFTNALCPSQLAEVGRYRERLIAWTAEGLAGAAALADYARLGWRVRVVGADGIPELRQAAARIHAANPERWTHTLWWGITTTPGGHWSALLEAAGRAGARTQGEAIRALYGEDIPPAALWLGFGKPAFSADMLPLLLAESVQCYWDQRPGYVLDEHSLRRILLDYACLRHTWVEDKTDRYRDVAGQSDVWNRRRILGVGRRVGAFWYPSDDQE